MPSSINTGNTSFVKQIPDTDSEIRSVNTVITSSSSLDKPLASNIKYLLAGIFFGILLVKAEVISWFRIQEMFRLENFHMYGVIGSAVAVGMLSVWLIKKFRARSVEGEAIQPEPRRMNKGVVYGGLIFGVGWAITGACPGPLFAQIGTGATVTIVTLLSAVAGTWVYGLIRNRLPH
ncbi:MAG: YeeE/YedE family protein [Chitinophagaceae bacterium]|nr:YeeE/YedE family protein [Chitinophagaceae bacterium]